MMFAASVNLAKLAYQHAMGFQLVAVDSEQDNSGALQEYLEDVRTMHVARETMLEVGNTMGIYNNPGYKNALKDLQRRMEQLRQCPDFFFREKGMVREIMSISGDYAYYTGYLHVGPIQHLLPAHAPKTLAIRGSRRPGVLEANTIQSLVGQALTQECADHIKTYKAKSGGTAAPMYPCIMPSELDEELIRK